MRTLLFLSILFALSSCAPSKPFSEATLSSGCPKDGDCTIEILQNKVLDIATEASGGISYRIADGPGKGVVRFKYSRRVKGDIQDAGYREEILLELSGSDPKSEMHSDLKNSKLIFGRFCFCKGQTGYYRITQGSLSKNGRLVSLRFSTLEVPQVVKEITFSLQ